VKSESTMWTKLRPVLLAAKLDPVRVENPICPGTPDVNLSSGHWIELKCLPDFPARDDLKLRIPHFTPQQRVWLLKRWRSAPGTTHLLLEIRAVGQWLLFDGDVAAKVVGRGSVTEHRKSARAVLGSHELARLPDLLKSLSNVQTLTRAEVIAELESKSRDLVGVPWEAAKKLLDAGKLHGSVADMVLTPLRHLLETPA
jgi:hypothetical protein